jgi:hypothetical protein
MAQEAHESECFLQCYVRKSCIFGKTLGCDSLSVTQISKEARKEGNQEAAIQSPGFLSSWVPYPFRALTTAATLTI